MCVAAVIFEPVELKHLECMEIDNPHGAGVAWEKDGKILFLKGLTAVDIWRMQNEDEITYPYLLHFRWATHGAISDELTHPFPLGPRALMGETKGESDKVLIHNGTWNYYDIRATRYMNDGNYDLPEEVVDTGSDTAIAAWLALEDESVLDGVPWATAMAEMRETCGVDGYPKMTMDITTRGTWHDHQGNWYSNLHWLPSEKSMYYFYNNHSSDESTKTFLRNLTSAEDSNWDTCIRGHGWKSYINDYDSTCRANMKMYVGKSNDICVNDSFYHHWYPEKDCYRPDNVEIADWYERFDWVKTAEYDRRPDGNGTTKTESRTKEKSTSEDSSGTDDDTADAESYSTREYGVEDARSWNEHLISKYGAEVAREISSCFPQNETDNFECEPETDSAILKGWKRDSRDPDWLHDGDLISDNPSEVNAWLARQMLKAG